MAHITVTRTINAPVETVFAYVDDYRNTTKYMTGLTKWEPAGKKTHGKGAVFAITMKAGPANLDGVLEVITWVENETIEWVSTKGVKQDGRWTFRKKGRGSEVTLDTEVTFPGGIAGKVVAKAAEPILRMQLEKSVEALKARTEGK